MRLAVVIVTQAVYPFPPVLTPNTRDTSMLRRITVLLLACLSSFALAATVSADKPLRLMANTSPPYADARLPEQGLALEIVRHVFRGTGHEPQFAIESWSRAVEGARLGVYDGLATAWYSPERAQDLLFSEPYLDSELIILKLRGNPRNYRQLSDLAGARLGVRTDYAYGVDFDSVPNLQLVRENHLIQNLLNLLNGSVDLVIGDRRTVTLQIHEYLKDKITQFDVVALELPPVQRHVAVSLSLAGHEDIIAAFNRSLASARKDGSLQAIITRWDERYTQID
jgi:polar amino acid transport system substrate-binding protein